MSKSMTGTMIIDKQRQEGVMKHAYDLRIRQLISVRVPDDKADITLWSPVLLFRDYNLDYKLCLKRLIFTSFTVIIVEPSWIRTLLLCVIVGTGRDP